MSSDSVHICSGWKVRPVDRFSGERDALWRDLFLNLSRVSGPFVGNTSFPLLVIGNTADPVTPLAQ